MAAPYAFCAALFDTLHRVLNYTISYLFKQVYLLLLLLFFGGGGGGG